MNQTAQVQSNFDGHPDSNSFVQILDEQGRKGIVRYDTFVAGLFKVESPDRMRLHAALGICGEAGELGDAIKKEVVYGKGPDLENIIEELGDLRFYIQAVQNLYGISEQELLQKNANKLARRYQGLTYSNAAAIERADKADGVLESGKTNDYHERAKFLAKALFNVEDPVLDSFNTVPNVNQIHPSPIDKIGDSITGILGTFNLPSIRKQGE